MSGPEAHHELGPSTLKNVEVCPGFRSTSEENIFTIEGTKMHESAETGNLEGLDDEQTYMVKKVLEYRDSLMTGNSKLILEQRIHIAL
jgi:hypothetical protein